MKKAILALITMGSMNALACPLSNFSKASSKSIFDQQNQAQRASLVLPNSSQKPQHVRQATIPGAGAVG